MPKKKTEAAAAVPISVQFAESLGHARTIVCPACKSKISVDGKTLHEKSSYLEELLETDGNVDQVEKHLSKLGKENEVHQATIADLRAQLAEAQKKLSEKKETSSVVQKQKRGDGDGDAKSGWD